MRQWAGRLLFFLAIVVASVAWCVGNREPDRPWLSVEMAVVDYTVPFDDYKEHRGLFWLLNHLHVQSPGGFRPWLMPIDYIGYYPGGERPPRRLASADLGAIELLYVADTYGVYRDDLKDPVNRRAHMDHNPVVFGGLSMADAETVDRFVTRGGTAVLEFNSVCDPTGEEPRRLIEEVTGTEWSGWVGRTFADLYDTDDVPYWLPREFARQFPGRELPHKPTLVVVDRKGTLVLFEGESVSAIVPRLALTTQGSVRLGFFTAPVPYYYWFPLMRARPETRVHANWLLPASADAFLRENRISHTPPAMTEAIRGLGTAYSFSGDFADIDFDPGRPDRLSPAVQRLRVTVEGGQSAEPIYWHFYTPTLTRLLGEFPR